MLLTIELIQLIILNKTSPVMGLEWPRWFQKIKVPRFINNGTGWW